MAATKPVPVDKLEPFPTSSVYPLRALDSNRSTESFPTFGRPITKKTVTYADLLILAGSVICLTLAILSITLWAYDLGLKNQLIVIGFLLSLMNVCMRSELWFMFLLLETKHGSSRLQNYEAILTSRIFVSNASWIWRLVLLLTLALPIGLGVAYKQFLGGEAFGYIKPSTESHYGLDWPRAYKSNAPIDDSIYFLQSALLGYNNVTANGVIDAFSSHIAAGANTLVTSNKSAVLLDVPRWDFVQQWQARLHGSDNLLIWAAVNGLHASIDTESSSKLVSNDSFWAESVQQSLNMSSGLNIISMYTGDGTQLGYMPLFADGEVQRVLFGLYDSPANSSYSNYFYELRLPDDPDQAPDWQAFRSKAKVYTIKRVPCDALWGLDKTGLYLKNGTTCNESETVEISSFFKNFDGNDLTGQYPASFATLPSARTSFQSMIREKKYQWLNTTSAVYVATMYWARQLELVNKIDPNRTSNYTSIWQYSDPKEQIMHYREALSDSFGVFPALYFIVIIQPVITFAAFIAVVCLRKVPIGRGFGLVSILSGFDGSSSKVIEGAALSGETKGPVRLEVVPLNTENDSSPIEIAQSGHANTVQYRLVGTAADTQYSALGHRRPW